MKTILSICEDQRRFFYFSAAFLIILSLTMPSIAQSGAVRPRRSRTSTAPPETSDNSSTQSANGSDSGENRISETSPLPDRPRPPALRKTVSSTAKAFDLLQQKLYTEAAREAQIVIDSDEKNTEAWKIKGFAEFYLRQYEIAANDLQRALDLQRAEKAEDPNTIAALAEAYARTEKFDKALPLLISATSDQQAQKKADPVMLYYLGISYYRTGKLADAEQAFNSAIKADPKNSAALYYLGRIAYERKDYDAAINLLNRATLSDANSSLGWALLTEVYVQRAAAKEGNKPDEAQADYLNAVRAGGNLYRIKPDAAAAAQYGQALLGAGEYIQAAGIFEKAAAGADADGSLLYLLGFAYSRAKNFPRAISALERAAQKTPDQINIYRELGYDYESSRQFAKALVTYQKAARLAPEDVDLQAAIKRVKPPVK